MTELQVGDRVRVKQLSTTGDHAGMTGKVVWVIRNPVTDVVTTYRVQLDRKDILDVRTSDLVASFRPQELAPVTG